MTCKTTTQHGVPLDRSAQVSGFTFMIRFKIAQNSSLFLTALLGILSFAALLGILSFAILFNPETPAGSCTDLCIQQVLVARGGLSVSREPSRRRR